MAGFPNSCHHGRHMKSRLCYAWFGDEDVKQIVSSLTSTPPDSVGESAGKASPVSEGHHREIRREPPPTQPLFKRP